jgi:hypothetical protein
VTILIAVRSPCSCPRSFSHRGQAACRNGWAFYFCLRFPVYLSPDPDKEPPVPELSNPRRRKRWKKMRKPFC